MVNSLMLACMKEKISTVSNVSFRIIHPNHEIDAKMQCQQIFGL